MSGAIIAIMSVGVGLAVLLVGSFAWLRQDMNHLRAELRQDINGLRGEVAETRSEVSQLRERMAHLEGLLEGLREAITRQVAG